MHKSITSFALIFSLAAMVAANCDFSQNFCCLSGFSCPATSNSFSIGGDSFSLGDFNLLSFNDVTINHGDVQGRVATRNNFYGVNGISVGDTLTDDKKYSLVVGGSLVWSDTGNVFPVQQGVFTGNTGAVAPDTIIPRITSTCATPGCLNAVFDELLSYWSQFSSTLSNQADNVDVTYINGVATISCRSSTANAYYLRVNPAQFSQITGYAISANCAATASFVVNIIGSGDVLFEGNSINTTGSYVIFNVGPSANVNIGSSVYGNIVAPVSNINMNGGTIYGQVVAGNYSNVIQVNTVPQCPSASTTVSGQCVPGSSVTGTASGSTPSTTGSNTAATTGAESSPPGFSTFTAVNDQTSNSNNGNTSGAIMASVSIFAAMLAVALL